MENLFDKQIYTIVFKVTGDNWSFSKVLANDNEDAERIIKEEPYHQGKEVKFSVYNPYKIEKVSDYINETTIKRLLVDEGIILSS